MKTWEMIKTLTENPNLKFKKVGSDLIYYLKYNSISCTDGEISVKSGDIFDLKYDWELVREPVDFMTAINSGKPITSLNGCRIKCTPEWILKHGMRLTLDDINDKWYIEE